MTAARLRWVLVGVISALMVLLLLRKRAREQTVDPGLSPEAIARLGADAAVHSTDESPAADASPALARTVRDPGVRDDVRRRIWAAWNQQGPATAPPSADPLHAPMPVLESGAVDPQYLRQRIREDFVPMAQVCYESFLSRRPGTSGRALMDFTIVGDPSIGGVIDEATVGDANADAGPEAPGVFDPEFVTCLRESLMTVAFAPPPQRGRLRVRYPLQLRPDAPDAATAVTAPASAR